MTDRKKLFALFAAVMVAGSVMCLFSSSEDTYGTDSSTSNDINDYLGSGATYSYDRTTNTGTLEMNGFNLAFSTVSVFSNDLSDCENINLIVNGINTIEYKNNVAMNKGCDAFFVVDGKICITGEKGSVLNFKISGAGKGFGFLKAPVIEISGGVTVNMIVDANNIAGNMPSISAILVNTFTVDGSTVNISINGGGNTSVVSNYFDVEKYGEGLVSIIDSSFTVRVGHLTGTCLYGERIYIENSTVDITCGCGSVTANTSNSMTSVTTGVISSYSDITIVGSGTKIIAVFEKSDLIELSSYGIFAVGKLTVSDAKLQTVIGQTAAFCCNEYYFNDSALAGLKGSKTLINPEYVQVTNENAGEMKVICGEGYTFANDADESSDDITLVSVATLVFATVVGLFVAAMISRR